MAMHLCLHVTQITWTQRLSKIRCIAGYLLWSMHVHKVMILAPCNIMIKYLKYSRSLHCHSIFDYSWCWLLVYISISACFDFIWNRIIYQYWILFFPLDRINRENFNELKIEQVLTPKAIPPLLQRVLSVVTPPEPILSGIKPPMSRSAWLRFLLTHLPILHWMWTYKAQYLFREVIAGISVAMLHVPQG